MITTVVFVISLMKQNQCLILIRDEQQVKKILKHEASSINQ